MELSLQNTETSSNEPETKGFDLSAGNTWVYPENYLIRQYQYHIVKSALYHNTLVCLPTGLGKTFIAAVVMYNFWRWYPFGKIVFLAPTKPLVAQQIDACSKVMGIPNADMIELTGAVNQKNREIAWFKKRIIFATPQIFHNDLERSIISTHLIKCVVVDEAHKALGKHSYCESIRILSTQNQYVRILALSATPGNKINNVHEVIQNLHISHLELRDENSIDIMPYINKRKVDIILVPLSNELAAFKERYIAIMDRHVRVLMQYNILRGQTANISKGRVFYLLKEFKMKTDKSGNYGQIMKTLNILLTMYHAYELMIRHGLRAFCKFYQTHSDKFWIHNEDRLRDLLHDIETYLGPFPDIYPNGQVSEISTNLVFGHNKFYKLKELLEHHFKSNNGDQKDTRAIVFVEYRDIVNEVYILLLQSKPIIRPQMFVGQVSQKQKQQIKALEDFRSNRVNVLISTSIGEEGLDVGEVDLIICFDMSQHSPIRLVQRMGRTGRKRDGHIIVLVTDGKEHENLKSTLSRRDSLNNKILNTSSILCSLYENNPRMIPNKFTPECHKIHITAAPKTPNIKGKRKMKDNKKNETISIKQQENLFMKKHRDQLPMMKFLTNNKCNKENGNNTYNILTQVTTQNNKMYNTINPNNVKLLSDNNAGIDFLTLCAVKKSEEEMSSDAVHKMDMTYIPTPKPVKDLFNFIVPDIKVIDCLSSLTKFKDDLLIQCKNDEDDLPTHCKNNENENICNNNDGINIDDDNFWCTIQNNKNVNNDKVRFEDILDESSDSNETIISRLSQQITDIEINLNNMDKVRTADMKDDNKIINDVRPELSSNILEDLEPSIFENLLNDSFSSAEDDLENGDTTIEKNVSSNSLNVFSKNTEKNSLIHKNTVNIFHDEDNVVTSKQNPLVSMEFTKPNQTNQFARDFADEIQDFNFNNDDDINEFLKCEPNKNNLIRNSNAEDSLLSVSLAIDEITRMKNNIGKSPKPSISKEESIKEDDSGWISVNIKGETQVEKRNTNSEIGIKLSNINHNPIAKSCTFKQDLDFLDDSDEDFIITEDNVKKFDEVESSYFHNTSQTWKDESNWLPSTSTSRNTKIEDSYHITVGNTLKNMKPCGMSMPTSNRRFGLSLKRNKDQHSNVMDLIHKPSKYANKDRSIVESNFSTSKQTSPLDKKVVQKIKHRHKCRNNVRNEFIDDEAEVESGASSDEIIITDEEDLADFVSFTEYPQDQVDMYAHYLQTVKSPIKQPGAFCFREPHFSNSDIEIYSQPRSQMQNSYINDSFCVEDVEPSTLVGNNSILERAEKKLERNRQRKRLFLDKDRRQAKKKKANILNHSVSSEDEIEKLRMQVQGDN